MANLIDYSTPNNDKITATPFYHTHTSYTTNIHPSDCLSSESKGFIDSYSFVSNECSKLQLGVEIDASFVTNLVLCVMFLLIKQLKMQRFRISCHQSK